MKSPLISCIVPVYNGERYLGETLDSILAQTHSPVEVIVVNDGSTDGTASVAARYGDRIRYLQQLNAGPATARNLGLAAAQGEFIAFLDADDLWHVEKLERQMARFHACPELGYCLAHVQNFWVPELIEEEKRYRDHRISKPIPGYSSCTLLARRTLFETIGPFNTAIDHADDTDWFLRASEIGAAMEMLPDVLLYRRLHRTNISRVRAANSREHYLLMLKATLDRRRRQRPPFE
jgi:glycosyltransferase involved in cell wall biosynthesis